MDIATKTAFAYLAPRRFAISRYPADAEHFQRKRLSSLIRRAAQTEWGRMHDFNDIRSYEEFAAKVPVCSYDDLKGYIERMRMGEKDVLWRGQIKYFAKSSGTTSDRSKFIPVSKEGLRRLHMMGGHDATAIYLSSHPESKVGTGNSIILSGSLDPDCATPASEAGDVSAIMTEFIPEVLRDLMHISPPLKIARIRDFEQKREALARWCADKDITSISGVPSWMLSVLTRVLELTGKSNLSEVWPNLELFVHGGVGFAPYREIYKQLIPSEKMHYIETYNASEGFFGIQNDPSDPALLLMVDYDIFYEFIPTDPAYGKDPVPVWKVEPGVNYAMCITTSCGLWRYLIGDTVRFTQKNPYKFILTGRTKQFINAFGEEVIVDNAEKAISAACKACGAEVREYTAAPVYMDSKGQCRHQWLIEFEKEPASLSDFEVAIDNALRSVNSDYDAKRYKDITLQHLEVIPARKGLFDDWLQSKGKLGGQHKVPRLNNTREYIEELLALNAQA